MEVENSSIPTAEELAAAQAIIAHAAGTTHTSVDEVKIPQMQSVSTDIIITEEDVTAATFTKSVVELDVPTADLNPESNTAISSEIVAELTTLFTEAMTNPDFFTKDSRVVALRNALKVPVSDDRSYHQCYIHANSALIAKAAKLSATTGTPVVMPSEVDIHALAQVNFEKKLAEKTAKAARAAKPK